MEHDELKKLKIYKNLKLGNLETKNIDYDYYKLDPILFPFVEEDKLLSNLVFTEGDIIGKNTVDIAYFEELVIPNHKFKFNIGEDENKRNSYSTLLPLNFVFPLYGMKKINSKEVNHPFENYDIDSVIEHIFKNKRYLNSFIKFKNYVEENYDFFIGGKLDIVTELGFVPDFVTDTYYNIHLKEYYEQFVIKNRD